MLKHKEKNMSHISSTSRWNAPTTRWDAALVALSIAVSSFVIIGVLWMTGVFKPNWHEDQAIAEAIQRSLEAKSFSSAPGLVWKRSLG
jgi:hypothetical protein